MSTVEKIHINKLYKVLDIKTNAEANRKARILNIPKKRLQYYNDEMILPSGEDLRKILEHLKIDLFDLKIRLGILDRNIVDWIAANHDVISKELRASITDADNLRYNPKFVTAKGKLYQMDSLKLMKSMDEGSVDMVFADPPFNLSKEYESGIDDNLSSEEYLQWTEQWLIECVRILKPGGSIFVYNIPKWLTHISGILDNYMQFRHWISINLRGMTPPISKKLNVNHYGVLYYTKGESPNVFNTQRIPMKTCRHCGGEIHDYGGKKKDVPVNGQTISDVWEDIHPVRHIGHKNREENELPIKLLYRVISLSTNEDDIVFDPFGGSGTTYVAAELLNRQWIGCEIGSIEPIIKRFKDTTRDREKLEVFLEESDITFTDAQRNLRKKNSFWLLEDFHKEQ